MPDDELVALPARGRVFSRERRVRLGDASPAGRLRLDALARYLQDVSNDDTRDAQLADEMTWVVRRTMIEIEQFPVFGEELRLRTFCSGTGPRWAERRVSVSGHLGGHAEASTLWVFVDADGRAAPLPAGFMERFGESADGRVVRARLRHPEADVTAPRLAWPLRFTDFDVLGHMNNAAYWSAVEEILSARRHLRAPLRAELEFRTAVEARPALTLLVRDEDDGAVTVWLTAGDAAFATAVIRAAA